MVYRLLQFVSRTRGDGATVVEIGTHLGIEQGAAFHYVQVAVNCGAVLVIFHLVLGFITTADKY